MTDCVKVALRVRPLIGLETAKGDNESVITYPAGASHPQLQIGGDKCFTFDNIFNESSAQTQVYQHAVKPLVDAFLEGYNATVIAYGQTGSGKTYTMGTAGCDDAKLQEEWGVIPAAINDVFRSLQSAPDKDDYKVQCSFIEIYNEEIKDLLDAHSSKVLSIRESADGPSKLYIPNMKLEVVHTPMDCLEALDRGGASRATAYTQMNSQSSRSHAIFTIHLHHIKQQQQQEPSSHSTPPPVPGTLPVPAPAAQPIVIQSKFHFVDLAGSERAKKTGASGTRFQEGVSINAGLLALGNVIAALGDPRCRSKHVPFRDSKITRLLQDSLGGNSRTLMIACVSPARSNMLETKNTLNYANRAKNIENKAVVNRDPRSRQILELRQRVKELERQLKIGGGGGGGNGEELLASSSRNSAGTGGGGAGGSSQEHVEQIWQLQSDLSASNHEVLKLQEKLKHLRLTQSELQDKYYRDVSGANTRVVMQQRKWNALLERVREKYPEFESEFCGGEERVENEEEILNLERMRLQNEYLQNEIQRLQRTIVANESRDQHLVHNLHHQMAKLVRGDFSVMRQDLISPTKQIDVSSSSESLPVFSAHSENHQHVYLLDGTDNDDEEDEDLDDEDDDDDDEEDDDVFVVVAAPAEGVRAGEGEGNGDGDDDDDDNDISMTDNNNNNTAQQQQQPKPEHAIEYTEATTEREALRAEKKQSLVQKKKLMKEQKQHDKQMEFIANEQVSRERSQRLKSEKFNREIDKTNRDITQLQTMLKQLCQQRQSDLSKQAFYEKQVETLTQELDEAHVQCEIHETEKTSINPSDTKKYAAQEIKIANYQNKVKSLTLQIASYRDKLGQIRKLQNVHRQDVQKMSQMTFKVNDLKKKKVTLQRRLKEENKCYARWKCESEKTIKQLRKTQRDKSIQLQRHKTQLTKTESALKQKTAALMHLKKRQRELELLKNKNRRSRNVPRTGRANSPKMTQNTMKQIKTKIAELLTWFVTKHALFHKYKSFDREYKSLQHQLREYESALCDVHLVLNQFREQDIHEDEAAEYNRLLTEKVENEQRMEDTQSTIAYIREQMVAMSARMKQNDPKRWKQLHKDNKVSLACTPSDLDRFLAIDSVTYARACINFLINQHLRFRLIVDEFKQTTTHLKSERDKILANADNELRKKSVLIEKLQNRIQEIQLQQQQSSNGADGDADGGKHGGDEAEEDDDGDDEDEDGEEAMLTAENEWRRKQTELSQSKKLLNLFRSPLPPSRSRVNANVRSFSVQPQPPPVPEAREEQTWNNTNGGEEQTRNTNGHQHAHATSIQLTPFHTPIVRSKTQSAAVVTAEQVHISATATNTAAAAVHSHNHNHSHMGQGHDDWQSQSQSLHAQRESSHSPLCPVNFNHHSEHCNSHEEQLASIHENENEHMHGNLQNNVFSRLTNPKHYIGTARNKVQELQALKEKARKQKESHTQLQKKSHWQKARIKMQFQPQQQQQQQHSPFDMNHDNNDAAMHEWAVHSDDDVFQRLHATSIRNTRIHNTGNGGGSLNNSLNQSAGGGGEMQPQQSSFMSDPLLSSEPSRVLNQNEMNKKPQRNSSDANAKSFLMNPVRVISPET